MVHSLQLDSSQATSIYKRLKLEVSLTQLKDAFGCVYQGIANVSGEDITARLIDEHFRFTANLIDQPQHLIPLYNMLTYFSEKQILSRINIQTILDDCVNVQNDRIGKLSINDDSIICICWNVACSSGVGDYMVHKVNHDLNEIVPESIIKLLDSSFLCLDKGFNLSALSLALLAVETALWDHLSSKGIPRESEYESFPNKSTGKLVWDGHNYTFNLLDHNGFLKIPAVPGSIDFDIFRSSKKHRNQSRCYLEIDLMEEHAEWLSNSSDRELVVREHAGLSVALQRARRENLQLFWEKSLDETFRVLRNSLAHHPSDPEGIIIRTPFGNVSLDKFSNEPDLILFFVEKIISYISNAYYDCRVEGL